MSDIVKKGFFRRCLYRATGAYLLEQHIQMLEQQMKTQQMQLAQMEKEREKGKHKTHSNSNSTRHRRNGWIIWNCTLPHRTSIATTSMPSCSRLRDRQMTYSGVWSGQRTA